MLEGERNPESEGTAKSSGQRVTIVGWRNWGDHPLFVIFTVVATVAGLALAYVALGSDESAASDPCVAVVGRWNWLTVGGIVSVAEGGTLRYHPNDLTPVPMFTGTWDCDAGSGEIAMRWNTGFSDKLRLSEDGNRLHGTNDQNGSTVSAVRAK